ncbi:MAG: DegT/DnrJ/EryC1/StrS family aminotransferase [Candidatus Omnitrophica bacterium]|nr:DegT/DnrJ/EryC1/StrS family aminotransferase [Candidatus Omnitrophota bacterium]MDD5429617.1 DegT/DnrJ/EryC1/StrS family aminotransferase [Candidatus Omnitrophota bacterium]
MKPFSKPIYVTRPLLPDRKAIHRKLDEILDAQWLTNRGPQHKLFEKEITRYLKVPYVSLVNNGTSALQLACRVLRLTGEVITTPFTFPATPHALYWNNIKPVFCDIEEASWNIDPSKIEALITPATSAILPVHVFGNPCDTKAIQKIADKYRLKVVYDAAHCFGVKVGEKGIGNFGDASAFSFHATKVFNTLEGGAITCKDPAIKERIDLAKNFGFQGENTIVAPGINAKMDEFQAAFGLVCLKILAREIKKRKKLTAIYQQRLSKIEGIDFATNNNRTVEHNYYNFVIRVDEGEFGKSRDQLYEELKKYNIFTRKYFYPLCSQFQCYRDSSSVFPINLPVAGRVSKEVLSLPLYGGLAESCVSKICDIVEALRKSNNQL